MQPRDYEAAWRLPDGLCRLCVQFNCKLEESAPVVAAYVSKWMDGGHQVLLEGEEVYTRIPKLEFAKQRRLIKIEDPQSTPLEFSEADAANLYDWDIMGYAFLCRESELATYILDINARDLIFTCWTSIPKSLSLSQICYRDRFERGYLENMTEFDPFMLFSRDHDHLEVYTRSLETLHGAAHFFRERSQSAHVPDKPTQLSTRLASFARLVNAARRFRR